MRGITKYSDTIEGTKSNYNWPVQFDLTNGFLGITQTHTPPLLKGEPPLERVLLTRRQVKELLEFVRKKARK